MKIIIDIPEETYEYWQTHAHEYVLSEAIKNGTLLSAEGEYIKKEDAYNCFLKWRPYMATRIDKYEKEMLELPTYSFHERRIEYGTDGNLYEMSISNGKELSFPDREKGEWIPVTEKLPEEDSEVVYCSTEGVIGTCHYYKGFNNYPQTDSKKYMFDNIVAWLPIPKPYISGADMKKGENE